MYPCNYDDSCLDHNGNTLMHNLMIERKLYEFSHLSKSDILTLVENDIKTLDDLADLDSEELFTLLGKKVFNNENEAGEVIMEARKHWFEEDKN